MPVRWTIDHSKQYVEAVAEGPTDVGHFVRLLDAVEAENAVPYRKMLDLTHIEASTSGENMPAIAERMTRFRNPGPIAVIVAPRGPQDGLARLFLLIAEAQGRARVFRVATEARQWLEAQAAAEPTSKPLS